MSGDDPSDSVERLGRGKSYPPTPTHPNTVALGAAGAVAVGGLSLGPHPPRTGHDGVTVETRADGWRPGRHMCCLPATQRKHCQGNKWWALTPLCLISTPGSQAPPGPLLPPTPPSPHAPHL